MSWRAALAAGAALAVVVGVYAISRRRPTSSGGRAHDRKGPKVDEPTLNDRLLAAARELVPPGSPPLTPDAPGGPLDAAYGGRLANAYGRPAWSYYQELTGPSKSGGTTCGVALAYFMSLARWPSQMINRSTTDPVAPGGGFVPGLHISKIVGGAQGRGWYLRPATAWQPGDVYHVDHPPKPNSDHVGVVESVIPLPGGTYSVSTIDGGQGPGDYVSRQTRILSADGKTITLNGVQARVLGIIRASGNIA